MYIASRTAFVWAAAHLEVSADAVTARRNRRKLATSSPKRLRVAPAHPIESAVVAILRQASNGRYMLMHIHGSESVIFVAYRTLACVAVYMMLQSRAGESTDALTYVP